MGKSQGDPGAHGHIHRIWIIYILIKLMLFCGKQEIFSAAGRAGVIAVAFPWWVKLHIVPEMCS